MNSHVTDLPLPIDDLAWKRKALLPLIIGVGVEWWVIDIHGVDVLIHVHCFDLWRDHAGTEDEKGSGE